MSNVNKRCAEYLKEKNIPRILEGLKYKYESLNKIGGSFVLKNPSEKEKLFLRSLFKKDYSDNKQISISLKKFVNGFENTDLEGICLNEVLELYFGEKIISNKDTKKIEKLKKDNFYNKIISESKHDGFKSWIVNSMDIKSISYKWLSGMYTHSVFELREILIYLQELIIETENSDFVILPIIAAKITKNPHALDENEKLFKGFLYYISYIHDLEYPKSAEDKSIILELGNVLTNTINRSISTYGLLGKREGVDLNWEGFHKRKEPLLLTDLNFRNTIIESIDSCVYCFENPSLFLSFIKKFPTKSAICTSGQINQTVYKLLNILEKSKCVLYYNGDYDPEGLLIASKLKTRYKNLKLFGYTEKLYLKAKSNIIISDKRLNQIKKINEKELYIVKELILQFKKAGYQEYILDELLELVK